MATTVTVEPIEATPGIPEDDLPDTVITPSEALALLPEPTLQQVWDGLRSLARSVDAGMDRLPSALEQHLGALVAGLAPALGSISASEAVALQHLVDTLETLGARGMMITKPYAAQMHVRTPNGYGATFVIERVDGKEFFAALAGMEAWLKQAGYMPLA